MSKKRLGEFLISKKLITRFQLESALQEQHNFGRKLGDILLDHGFVSEGHLIEAISEFKNIKFVDLATVTPSKTALAILPAKFCKENMVYPLRLREENSRKVLYVVLTDSFNLDLLDQIKFRTNVSKVEPVIGSERAIESAIQRDYFKIEMMVPKLDYITRKTTDLDDIDSFEDAEIIEDDNSLIKTSSNKNSTSKKTSENDENIIVLEAEIAVLKELVKDLEEDLKGLDKRNKGILKLLINKGFITREEYFQELKR